MTNRVYRLGGINWNSGDYLYSKDLNDSFENAIDVISRLNQLSALNTIRQIIDRSITFEEKNWGDAYIDSTGRFNSVESTEGVVFDTDAYEYGKLTSIITDDAEADNVNWSTRDNAYDGDSSTYAEYSESTSIETKTIIFGNTFSARENLFFKYKVYHDVNLDSAYSQNWNIKIQVYDGSSWNDYETIKSGSGNDFGSTWSGNVLITSEVQGIRIKFDYNELHDTTHHWRVYQFEYGYLDTEGYGTITHNVPSGIYSSNISSIICIPMTGNWEIGANIQFSLSNSIGEETPWIDYNTVTSFVPFTEEPNTIVIKLIPSSNPSLWYPSIKGFIVKEL